MTLSSRRKRIGVVIGVLLLAGLGGIVWPFMVGPGRMQSFCSSLAAGAPLAQIRVQAAQHGYRVSSPVEGRAFVHEPRSFGRFTCDLQFGSDGLASSVYLFND